MKLSTIGFSREDLDEIQTISENAADTLKDVNGAPPSEGTGDYDRYLRLNRIAQVCDLMVTQSDDFDTANLTTTDPVALLVSQSGGY